jgi:pSer/pThr/pTyr-binding forkhead associated (FHA) protein
VNENVLIIAAVIVLCIAFISIIVSRRKADARGKTKEIILQEPSKNIGETRVLPVGMLIAKTGGHRGMVFAIEPEGIKIGRDKTKNDVVINSEVVSREHAWIGLENGSIVIRDLKSRNGTYINSVDSSRINSEVLKDGDVIFIGKAGTESFKFKAG